MGPIAQSVEQRTFNPWVDGSSPSGPTETSFFQYRAIFFLFSVQLWQSKKILPQLEASQTTAKMELGYLHGSYKFELQVQLQYFDVLDIKDKK